jgi:hypothetical protein
LLIIIPLIKHSPYPYRDQTFPYIYILSPAEVLAFTSVVSAWFLLAWFFLVLVSLPVLVPHVTRLIADPFGLGHHGADPYVLVHHAADPPVLVHRAADPLGFVHRVTPGSGLVHHVADPPVVAHHVADPLGLAPVQCFPQ